MKILSTILLLSLSILSTLKAETIILKSGKVLEGQVLSQSRDSITLKSSDGKKQSLPKTVVYKVLYKTTPDETKKHVTKALELTKKELEKSKSKDQKDLEEHNRLEEERIRELEKSLEELKIEQREEDEVIKLRDRINQLESRLQDMETFLNLNTDWKEKYLAKRNMWSAVWRSALIPGWGHSYIGEYYPSNFYLSVFLLAGLGYLGAQSAEKNVISAYNTKVRDLFVIRPVLTSAVLGTATALTVIDSATLERVSLLEGYTNLQRLNDFNKAQKSVDNAKANTQLAQKFVIGIYLVQLIHVGISAYFWERANVIPKVDEKKLSFSLGVTPIVWFDNTKTYQTDFQLQFRF